MPHHPFADRHRIALGAVRALLALVFLSAALAKLVGLPALVAGFEQIGFGQWFRYATGAIELGGAVLLLTRRFVGLGAFLLACTMVGAVIAHLAAVPGSPAPAVVLLIVLAVVTFAYSDRTLAEIRAAAKPLGR